MKHKNTKKITFDDYSKLLQETNFIQYGNIKGTIFFTPESFWVWKQIQNFLNQRFNALGIEDVAFPSLISKKALESEKKHIVGFAPEVLKITHVGIDKLSEPFYLRPTSEVVFAQYFRQVIKSYRDLPILLNQWVNVWRWEQNTKPFFRNVEFLWQEGHTAHFSDNNAVHFCRQIDTIYQDLINNFLLIPTFSGIKSDLEKFPGAKTSWSLETLMPDGQFLQMATTHNLSQTFAKAFDIKFLNATNQLIYPFQTSWGVSTRLLAGLIMTHMDEYGLKFPAHLAKIQIVVFGHLPLNLKSHQKSSIQSYIDQFLTTLNDYRFIYIDVNQTKKSLGYWQKYYWKKAVVVQIVIGRLEMQRNDVTYYLRNNVSVVNVLKRDSWPLALPNLFKQHNQELFTIANNFQTERIVMIDNYQKYRAINPKNAAYSVTFCGLKACELIIKNETSTVSRVLIPIQSSIHKTCFHCQKPAIYTALFGRSY